MKIRDMPQLHQFIEQFNFATLVSHHNSELNISHIPVILHRQQGPYGTLSWHVSKQNPHAKIFNGNKNALCIFHGPHAYISPTWYKSSLSVPTWNYAVVHAHGNPIQICDAQLESDLTQMVIQHEGNPNYIIPRDYKLQLMNNIVGFSMKIIKIEHIFKLGQNRSVEDQDGMSAGLLKESHNIAPSLAEFIQTLQK